MNGQQIDMFSHRSMEDLKSIRGEVKHLNRRPAGMDPAAVWSAGKIWTTEDGPVSFIGSITVKEGDHVKLVGKWEDGGPKFGMQFRAVFSTPAMDSAALQKVIERDERFRSIGPVRSKKITEYLDRKNLDLGEVLRDEQLIQEMRTAASLTREGIESLRQFWIPLEEEHTVKASLISLGVPPKVIEKVWSVYGSSAISILKNNPYDMVESVNGFTLVVADEIALKKMGILPTDARRIRCGISRALDAIRDDGHTWITLDKLMNAAASSKVLNVLSLDGRRAVKREMDLLIKDGYYPTKVIPVFGEVICPQDLLSAEEVILKHFSVENKNLSNYNVVSRLRDGWFDDVVKSMRSTDGVSRTPSDEQRAAVEAFVNHKCMVITGPAGSGKTFVISMIVSLCRMLKLQVAMAAPTGKAAKRMIEMIMKNGVDVKGIQDPKTIHLMLGYNGTTFSGAEINTDVLIIDESSMVDVSLMANVLRVLKSSTSLVMVGDHNQLPSVGPGAVLRDLVEGELVHVSRLGTVFRNAGPIRTNAAEIISRGIMRPTTIDASSGEATWELHDRLGVPKDAGAALVKRYRELLSKLGEPGLFDIQVLGAEYDPDQIGITALNQQLRIVAHEVLYGGIDHHDPENFERPTVGDKVMQTRNNYKIGVMNGDQGVIVATQFFDDQGNVTPGWVLKVQTGSGQTGTINVPKSMTMDFVLSYAISTHRFQGSEAPYILCMLHGNQRSLNRTLVYTMSTRASKKVFFVGDYRGVHDSVRKANEKWRRTLTMRLEALQYLKEKNLA